MSPNFVNLNLAETIVELVESTFNDYYQSNELPALLDAKETNLWNMFNIKAKSFIKENAIGTTIVQKKKHIFQVENNYFTFNKFNDKLKRSCDESQLTIKFKEGGFDKDEKNRNNRFEVGYTHKENIVKVYANKNTETQLLGSLDLNVIKMNRSDNVTYVEGTYEVLSMREKTKDVKNG